MEAGGWRLRLPGGCGPQRSEEVLEALNREKREIRVRFSWLLSLQRPWLPSSLQRLSGPHLLTVTQILVPKGTRPGPARPAGCLLSLPRHQGQLREPRDPGSDGLSGGQGRGCLSLQASGFQEPSGNPQTPQLGAPMPARTLCHSFHLPE